MEWVALFVAGAAVSVALVLGRRLQQSRRINEQLKQQLVRDMAAERALAAADERTRIAREMHDVVAHTLSVVVAQADGGRFAASADPAQAARALQTISEVGRSALAEMRALLGVLRGSESGAALGPQPSIGDVPTLVASMRDGGLEVSYVTTGTPRTVPIGAGIAIYRIVQEALTNVLKHAGPAVTAFVQLQWEADAVTVVVSDDGRGAAAHSDGLGTGLEGMRERTTIFSGTLDAGPKAGGGYLVRARLPLGTSIGAPAVASAFDVAPHQGEGMTSLTEAATPLEETQPPKEAQ